MRINKTLLLLACVLLFAVSCEKNKTSVDSPFFEEQEQKNENNNTILLKDTGDDGQVMEKDDQAVSNAQSSNNTQAQNQLTSNQSSGLYIPYTPEALAKAQAEGKKLVLFFHAPWCPFCRAADSSFNSNLSRVPLDVVLLKTDYDTEKNLKSKYGITYQHTFVQVDASGNSVTKWSGGGIVELISNIK